MAGPSIPGYERLTQIGKGGFSRVYRGEQAKLKRGVAIKVLNFGLNDEADRRSFERECELMGRVSTHPNIVTVHDTAFTDEGQPCIVMEHYPGGSLADLISEVRRLTPQEVLEVGVAISAALEASHQAGVLHCDLKPQNILISEFGQPALGDFGISTFSEERTRTGGDAGAGFTLAYAAPEIVEGASPSVESDLYSLAATLYTGLAGRRPFAYPTAGGGKPTAAEHARRILLEPPAPVEHEEIPVELDQLIRSTMAKDASQRPSSAADFAQSLYQVGRELGYGTSAPRIAQQGALPVLDSRTDVVEPSILRTVTKAATSFAQPAPVPLASPPVEADELTEARPEHTDATALRVDPMVPSTDAAPPASPAPHRSPAPATSVRRSLAPLIGLLGVLAVGAVVFFTTRGGSEPARAPEPTVSARTPQAEVLLAPPPPTDAAAYRVGADSLLVSWSNPAADDVGYEVRLLTRSVSYPATTSPVVIDGFDPNDTPCATVLAIRGNRLSAPADELCAPRRGDFYVEASTSTCEGQCQVSLELVGFPASTPVSVTALDGADGLPVEVEYSQELLTDSDGQAPDWRVTLDAGDEDIFYVLELAPGATTTARAVVVVSPGSP